MSASRKYPRTLHAHISLGTQSDDRFMPEGYVAAFARLPKLVMTEKLDGQNTCFNEKGVFARSHTAPSIHPWDRPMRERWERMKKDLGNLELFGENMFGIHSIEYHNLESYFYLFAVRQEDAWLSWEEVQFYAALFDFPTVPEIPLSFSLTDALASSRNENEALAWWLQQNLGVPWEEWVNTPGTLGGIDPLTGHPACEGLVIRSAGGFTGQEGLVPVASNELDSVFKLVRKGHVTTSEHWTKTWKPASLTTCETYQWYGYEHLIR